MAPNGNVYIADTHNQRIRKITGADAATRRRRCPRPTPVIIPCTDGSARSAPTPAPAAPASTATAATACTRRCTGRSTSSSPPPAGASSSTGTTTRCARSCPTRPSRRSSGTDFVGDGPIDLSDLTPEGADPLTVDLNHPTDVQEFPNGDLMLMCVAQPQDPRADARATDRVRVARRPRRRLRRRRRTRFKDALVNQPPHGELDADGNLFFIDQRNQRIRVIYDFDQDRGDGIIQTVVGTGDQRLQRRRRRAADAAQLPGRRQPRAVRRPGHRRPTARSTSPTPTTTASARSSFTDRRTSSQGMVTTIAGTGDKGFGGDGGPADRGAAQLPGGHRDRPRRQPLLRRHRQQPRAHDRPDRRHHHHRRRHRRGRLQRSTAARRWRRSSTGPFGVAFDPNGDLYISDTFNSRIRKVKR